LASRSMEMRNKHTQKPHWNLVREGNIILMKDNANWTFKQSVISYQFLEKDQAFLEMKRITSIFLLD